MFSITMAALHKLITTTTRGDFNYGCNTGSIDREVIEQKGNIVMVLKMY